VDAGVGAPALVPQPTAAATTAMRTATRISGKRVAPR
jgi:hypothetical protein